VLQHGQVQENLEADDDAPTELATKGQRRARRSPTKSQGKSDREKKGMPAGSLAGTSGYRQAFKAFSRKRRNFMGRLLRPPELTYRKNTHASAAQS
jgi:hypothetical protein